MRIGKLLTGFAFISVLYAQTPMRVASITAVGQASISVTPDLALVDLGVASSGGYSAGRKPAKRGSSRRHDQRFASLAGDDRKYQDHQLLGVAGVQQSSAGQNATIIGYLVTNIVEVRLTDLTLVGKVIDTAIQSGANRVQGVSFGLQDNTASVAQVLKTAASSALSQAAAIASGLNVHTGAVLHASEGVNTANPTGVSPIAGGASTPIETGMVVIQASVTIDVTITP